MCVMCNPAFAEAFRNYTFPSRRQMLKVRRRGDGRRVSLRRGRRPRERARTCFRIVADRFADKKLPGVTIFRAKDIVTLDPDKPPPPPSRSSATASWPSARSTS